jgi:type I restriction enzyme, S subunit
MNASGRQASLLNGWREMTLGEVADVFSGGTPSTGEPAYWTDGDVVWVTPTDITGLRSRFIADSDRKITRLALERSSARVAPAGAVLVTSRATIGATAIARIDVALNQGVTALVPHPEVDPSWLF